MEVNKIEKMSDDVLLEKFFAVRMEHFNRYYLLIPQMSFVEFFATTLIKILRLFNLALFIQTRFSNFHAC